MRTIKLPVNVRALAKAYRLAAWKWFDGYPSQERIRNAVDSALAELGRKDRWGGTIVGLNSGGMKFRLTKRLEKKLSIDDRLAKHYIPSPRSEE